MYTDILRVSGGMQHSELLGCWTVSTARQSKNYRTERLGNWVRFLLEMSGETPTSLGSLERATQFPERCVLYFI
jgi:hypothetical protein